MEQQNETNNQSSMRGKFLAMQRSHTHSFLAKQSRRVRGYNGGGGDATTTTKQSKHAMWINFCANGIVERTPYCAKEWKIYSIDIRQNGRARAYHRLILGSSQKKTLEIRHIMDQKWGAHIHHFQQSKLHRQLHDSFDPKL